MKKLLVAAVVAVAVSLAAVPLVAADAATTPLSLTTGLYVDPGLPAAQWVAANPSDGRTASIKANISSRPMARWFTGTSDSDVGTAVAKYAGTAQAAGNKLPVLVAYDLPGRDACGGQSSGGAGSASAYETWISTFAAAIGTRPAIVVIEPDSLGDFDCMTAAQISTRLTLLTFAARMFAQKAPNTWAYLDAGHPDWVDPATMAQRLASAGVAQIHGFAVDVSNFYTTASSQAYAQTVRSDLSSSSAFLIDTSRNGNGSNGEWCNPAGRKLGTTSTANQSALQLWIKNPGNSDGECGIAPTVPAGVFSPDLATRLISGT